MMFCTCCPLLPRCSSWYRGYRVLPVQTFRRVEFYTFVRRIWRRTRCP